MLRDKIKPLIPQIVTRELTNKAVAAMLGCAEESVCRVLKQLKVIREDAPNGLAIKEFNAARRAHRRMVATTMSIKDAAAAAGCSTRTIYRLRNVK